MNNLQLPPADAKPAEIAVALAELMRLHSNVRQGVIDAVRGFYPLDAHTLQHMRKLIAHPTMRHSYPKGRDFEQGEAYAFKRIDEVLSNAIEQAGGEPVKQDGSDAPEPEPEIPWDELHEWVQWVAMDKNGDWYGYDNEPQKGNRQWVILIPGEFTYIAIAEVTARDWRTSLRQRPKHTSK